MKIKYNWNRVGKTPTLMAMSAFYKNDGMDGIGLTITNENMDVGGFSSIIENLVNKATWTEKECRDQLEHTIKVFIGWGRKYPDDLEQLTLFNIIVFGNIRWLEKNGHLVADDYNGMQYVSVAGGCNNNPNLN